MRVALKALRQSEIDQLADPSMNFKNPFAAISNRSIGDMFLVSLLMCMDMALRRSFSLSGLVRVRTTSKWGRFSNSKRDHDGG